MAGWGVNCVLADLLGMHATCGHSGLTEGSGNVKFVLVAALLNLHLFALSRISHAVQMIV